MLTDDNLEKYNIRNSEKVEANMRFLTDFLRYLRNQQRKAERDSGKNGSAKAVGNIASLRRSTKMFKTVDGIASHYIP